MAMKVIQIPSKGPLTIKPAKQLVYSKEMQDKLKAIKEMAEAAGPEPDCADGLMLGPKDELLNRRLDKMIERDMIESMEDVD